MSDKPPEPAHDPVETRAKYERLLTLAEHMRHVIVALKDLVPKAFEEGFRRRVPDREEPWLVDWLQSDTKGRLDTLVPKPTRTLGDPPSKPARDDSQE